MNEEYTVDILEPIDTSRFTFGKLVDLKVATKEVATVVINGVAQQTQKVSYVVMTCPNCNKILYQLPDGVDLVEANKMLIQDAEGLNGLINYCPNCGQKLNFKRELVSEQKEVK